LKFHFKNKFFFDKHKKICKFFGPKKKNLAQENYWMKTFKPFVVYHKSSVIDHYGEEKISGDNQKNICD
jgi:hypothetical protein